jgi:DNA-3-methyladenine glycosylase II
MPAPKALLERGERWGPYRTYASLYLWRIADTAVKRAASTKSVPTKRSQD